jgi:hypothetical protein
LHGCEARSEVLVLVLLTAWSGLGRLNFQSTSREQAQTSCQ